MLAEKKSQAFGAGTILNVDADAVAIASKTT